MKRLRVQRLTIRAALVAGFSLMLGLWAFAGFQVSERMQAVQRESAVAAARYSQSQELLSSVRNQVLLASVLVRDALLDPDVSVQAGHRDNIEAAYQSIDSLLSRYVPFIDSPEERRRVASLRSEVTDLRAASNEVLATDSTRWPSDARALLRRFMPRREAAIRMSEEVQALNREAFINQQRAVAGINASMQRQVLTVFGVALAISLVIGLLASRYATRLERRLTDQHAREERISADLQRLSARLVQAREEEQRRIAHELHDEVGQALSAVKVQLTLAERRLGTGSAARELLVDALGTADNALRSVRDLSHLLHPSALDDLGLVVALDSMIADFRRRHRVAIEFTCDGPDLRQHPETERAIYRVVQEGLTNIARHSGATAGSVVLAMPSDRLRVTIEDNGVGFDVIDVERPGKRRGLGLLGIRERVARLGGTVHLDSTAGRGSRIVVELPRAEPPRVGQAVDPALMAALLLNDSEVQR